MGAFQNFPYTDVHQLNLDWIISQVKKLGDSNEELINTINKYFEDIDQTIISNIMQLADNGDIHINLKTFVYETVTDMKNATDITDDGLVITKGYHAVNDGGSAVYALRATLPTDTNDDMFTFVLNNNATAILLADKKLNVLQLGFLRDGTTDNSDLLNYVISQLNNVALYFPEGQYLFNSAITYTKHISLLGDECAFNGVDRNNKTVFISGVDTGNTAFTINANHVFVKNIMFFSQSYTSSADASLIDGLTNDWYSENVAVANVSGLSIASYNNEVSNCTFRGFSGTGLTLGLYASVHDIYIEQCGTGIRPKNDSILQNIFVDLCNNGIILSGSLTTMTDLRFDFIRTTCITLVSGSNSNIIRNCIADTIGENCVRFQPQCNDNDIECYGRVGYRYANATTANYANNPQYSCMVYVVSNCVGNTIRTSATQKTVNGVVAPKRTVVQSSPDHTHFIISGYKAIANNNEVVYTVYGQTPTDTVITYPYLLP